MQLGQLVLGQSLGWEQIQRSGLRVLQHALQNRQVVTSGLAGCGRGYDDQILPAQGKFRGLRLVGVEAGDAAGGQCLAEAHVERARECRVACLASGQRVIEGYMAAELILNEEPIQRQLDRHAPAS